MRIIFHCFASLTLEYDTQAEGLPAGVALTTTSTIFNHCIVVLLVVEYSLFASLVLAVCWSTLMHPHPGSLSSAARHEHRDVCTLRILYLLVCVMYLTLDQDLPHRPTSFQTLVVKMYRLHPPGMIAVRGLRKGT